MTGEKKESPQAGDSMGDVKAGQEALDLRANVDKKRKRGELNEDLPGDFHDDVEEAATTAAPNSGVIASVSGLFKRLKQGDILTNIFKARQGTTEKDEDKGPDKNEDVALSRVGELAPHTSFPLGGAGRPLEFPVQLAPMACGNCGNIHPGGGDCLLFSMVLNGTRVVKAKPTGGILRPQEKKDLALIMWTIFQTFLDFAKHHACQRRGTYLLMKPPNPNRATRFLQAEYSRDYVTRFRNLVESYITDDEIAWNGQIFVDFGLRCGDIDFCEMTSGFKEFWNGLVDQWMASQVQKALVAKQRERRRGRGNRRM